MCKIDGGKLLNNTGSPAWHSVMTSRGVLRGGEGGWGGYIYIYTHKHTHIYVHTHTHIFNYD